MRFFQKDELRLLWPFYLDSLISPMIYFLPAFLVVFLAGLEFSYFQIGVLIAATPLFMLIFEIPTGAIADLYGRKFSVLMGYILEALVILSLFYMRDFYFILGAFAVWGFANTLSSGSKEAWIVDLVKDKKIVRSYFHKYLSLDGFALIISGFVGVYVVGKFGLSSIWIFGFVSFLITIFILLFAEENFVRRKVEIGKSFRKIFLQSKKTISYGYRHHVLYYFLFATFSSSVAMAFFVGVSWTPFLLELDFPVHYFGYMWAAIGAIGMIAPIVSSKILKKNREKGFIMGCYLISAAVAFLVLFPTAWEFAFAIDIVALFFLMLKDPASKIYFHNFIPSKMRATMGSVDSMLFALASIISVPIVGLLIDLIGARYTILIYVPLILITVFIYSRIREVGNED